VLTRYTQPEPSLQLLIDRLRLTLPAQPPPKITATALGKTTRRSEDLLAQVIDSKHTESAFLPQSAKTG